MHFKRTIQTALSAALVVAFSPQAAFAQGTVESSEDTSIAAQEAAQLDQTLASGDYVQGQAIVVVDCSLADNLAGTVQSLVTGGDLLEGSELIMEADGSTFASATGQAQNTNVQVRCVNSDNLSTEELISKLLKDPRVISAEPNTEIDSSSAEDSAALTESTTTEVTASSAGAVDSVTPLKSSKATNITDTDDMPDLTEYQWYAGKSDVMKQPGSTTDSSLVVPGWNKTDTASSDTYVCVMDGGINCEHPDLKDSLADLTSYYKGTKYEGVANKHGFNAFTTDTSEMSNITDDDGHGTHIAGIMCASRNGKGVTGVASGAKIIGVKIFDGQEASNLAIIRGYEYLSTLVDQGVNLASVNGSWESPGASPSVELAMTKLGEKGVVSCIAAGNEQSDIDKVYSTTTTLAKSPYVLSIDSCDSTGSLSDFSNYGQDSTDVLAQGSSIMSTYNTSYVPFADPSPVYRTNVASGSEASTIKVLKTTKDAAPFGTGETVATYDAESSFDTGTGCLSIPLDYTTKEQCFEVQIPVTKAQVKKSAYLGYTVCCRSKHMAVMGSVALTTKKGTAYSGGTGTLSNTWFTTCFTLQDEIDNKGSATGMAYKDGYISLRLSVNAKSLALLKESSPSLMLDTIALGSNSMDYALLNGTSMATPCAAASVAVASSQLRKLGMSGAELAQNTIRAIKAAVIQKDDLLDLCTSGGYLSFSKLGTATPIIEGCSQDGDTLTVTGVGFGILTGSATLDSESASVKSWSSHKIVITVPDACSSGLKTLRITNKLGRIGSACVPVAAGEPAVYEKEIALPSGKKGPANANFTYMATIKNRIYVLCGTDSSGLSYVYKQLWSYNTKTGKWKKLASLPYHGALRASMTTYKGKLLVSCNGARVFAGSTLYKYVPKTNTWKVLYKKKVPSGAALVNLNGKVLCISGTLLNKDNFTDTKKIFKLNVKKGTLKQVGKLPRIMMEAQASACDGKAYVSNGFSQANEVSISKPRVYQLKWRNGKIKCADMSGALPSAAKSYMNSYGAAATPKGLAISGYAAATDNGGKSANDSFLLKYNKNGGKYTALSSSFSYGVALQTTSVYHKGWLYTWGVTYSENSSVIMRATKVA